MPWPSVVACPDASSGALSSGAHRIQNSIDIRPEMRPPSPACLVFCGRLSDVCAHCLSVAFIDFSSVLAHPSPLPPSPVEQYPEEAWLFVRRLPPLAALHPGRLEHARALSKYGAVPDIPMTPAAGPSPKKRPRHVW